MALYFKYNTYDNFGILSGQWWHFGINLNNKKKIKKERFQMKHIKTLCTANLKESASKGGCECQTSCQSASNLLYGC